MDNVVPGKEEKKEDILQQNKDVWEVAREKISPQEQAELEAGRVPAEDEAAIRKQLEKEIELMDFDGGLKVEAEQKAKRIEFLGEKEKLEHLLSIARDRGVAFAIKVAKEMNDPYILDNFHDLLVKEGFYKKFVV
ncbi:MAG: hypothetical protein WC845_01525 [Candidatus Staskawiczbacteria bacterium]|jgi:hypothetical protein